MAGGTLISSESTSFFKITNYLLLFCVAITFCVVAHGINNPVIHAVVLACIIVLALFVLRKIMVFGSTIADKVYDCGDFLRVVRHGEEQKISFSNITDVVCRHAGKVGSKYYIITLQLRNPVKFGAKIFFVAEGGIGAFRIEHPKARELMRRAQAAQAHHERTETPV